MTPAQVLILNRVEAEAHERASTPKAEEGTLTDLAVLAGMRRA